MDGKKKIRKFLNIWEEFYVRNFLFRMNVYLLLCSIVYEVLGEFQDLFILILYIFICFG